MTDLMKAQLYYLGVTGGTGTYAALSLWRPDLVMIGQVVASAYIGTSAVVRRLLGR